MKHPFRTTLIVAGGVQLFATARVLVFAVMFRWLPAELRDGQAAARSVELAISEELA